MRADATVLGVVLTSIVGFASNYDQPPVDTSSCSSSGISGSSSGSGSGSSSGI